MTLRRAMLAVAVLTAVWSGAGIAVRGTFGAHVAVDEPQYLLSATSLFEDGDLDISDELRDERWREYHEARLPEQTKPLAGGQRLSPHDPLLPLLLAVPMGLGGWVAAKVAMALWAGALAALMLWVAVRRLHLPLGWATAGVLAFTLSPPLAVYGTQVYPELPAALVVTAGVAAVTGRPGPRAAALAGAAVVVLPWLSVKYAPVAAALAGVALWRLWFGPPVRSRSPLPPFFGRSVLSKVPIRPKNAEEEGVEPGEGPSERRRRRVAVGLVLGLVVAGAVHVAVHQGIYGGFTPYAAGDHFVDGELTVVGGSPDMWGRGRRLLGLLVDRDFGLIPWQPLWLAAVPAAAALVSRRPAWWSALALPAAVGWATASFLALTMHGFWWPGRQVVVVLPLAALAVVWWLVAVAPAWGRAVLAGGAALGALTFGWLVAEGIAREVTWVADFWKTANPAHRLWRPLLPDLRALTGLDEVRYWLWVTAAAALAATGWRSAAGGGGSSSENQDAVGGEHTDAHGTIVDADGDGAVR